MHAMGPNSTVTADVFQKLVMGSSRSLLEAIWVPRGTKLDPKGRPGRVKRETKMEPKVTALRSSTGPQKRIHQRRLININCNTYHTLGKNVKEYAIKDTVLHTSDFHHFFFNLNLFFLFDVRWGYALYIYIWLLKPIIH